MDIKVLPDKFIINNKKINLFNIIDHFSKFKISFIIKEKKL